MASEPNAQPQAPPPNIEELKKQRQRIIEIAAAHGATNVRVVGSVARGEADERSDLDLLMDIDGRGEGFAYFGRVADLERALGALLGCKVDVIDAAALVRMRERVFRDAIPL